jgi:dihydrolipoamide dehydrogenase
LAGNDIDAKCFLLSHQAKNALRVTVVVGIAVAFVAFFSFHLQTFLTLGELKKEHLQLQSAIEVHPCLAALLFCTLYIATTALSIPGAFVFTLAGGALFGFWQGLLLVSLSSSSGATIAFLTSRFLLRDFVKNRFAPQMQKLQNFEGSSGQNLSRYLFSLRLLPMIPFFIVNLIMGVTNMKTVTFFIVSLLGMLPATVLYVNAGQELSKIDSMRDMLSPRLIFAFLLLAASSLLLGHFLNFIQDGWKMRHYSKPKKFDFNLIVIGAGSGGLVSAFIAATVKAKVALIEKHKMGGDCLNTGCVPSKALLRTAKIMSYFLRAEEFGIDALPARVNFQKVMDRVRQVIQKIEPHDSRERYRAMGVECFEGEAKIISPFEVQVGERRLSTRRIVVATGARPLVPPIPGIAESGCRTSDNIWELTQLPRRLCILGGGPIGCELAQAFSRLGSEVTIIEMGSRILSKEDEDVADHIATKFQNEKIRILTGHKVEAFKKENNGKFVICSHEGAQISIEYDDVLVALGRKANVTGFGLEELGVEITKQGTISVNPFMQTTCPTIYACGDVVGPYQFTHVAAHQAWYAAVNTLFRPFRRFALDTRVIPWCTFTDPEVARVGLSEAEASAQGIVFELSRYEFSELDRAIAEGEDRGFIKILTVPGKDKVLGVTIVGAHAGELITEWVTAMKFGFGLNKILGIIHVYPTFSEANKYAAGVWKKAHAPETALNFLQKFHAWRRN